MSNILSRLGLFVGEDLQDDQESVFFIRCNNWLLREGQATWDYPERFLQFSSNPEWLERHADLMHERLRRVTVQRYVGVKNLKQFQTKGMLNQAWGWKDPRNTYTLPLWLKLYPDAKVIHIMRHGVDVAASLVAREKTITRIAATLIKAVTLQWPRQVDGSLTSPFRGTSLDGAFSLWEQCTSQAHQQVLSLGDNALEVVFEQFLAEPKRVMERLCDFLGMPLDQDILDGLVGQVRPDRAFAYRNNDILSRFATRMQDRLAAFGYKEGSEA